jgi:hypothetical protein
MSKTPRRRQFHFTSRFCNSIEIERTQNHTDDEPYTNDHWECHRIGETIKRGNEEQDNSAEGKCDFVPEETPPAVFVGIIPDLRIVERLADPEAINGIRADLTSHQRSAQSRKEQTHQDLNAQEHDSDGQRE